MASVLLLVMVFLSSILCCTEGELDFNKQILYCIVLLLGDVARSAKSMDTACIYVAVTL